MRDYQVPFAPPDHSLANVMPNFDGCRICGGPKRREHARAHRQESDTDMHGAMRDASRLECGTQMTH
jgi:hypothetical protein